MPLPSTYDITDYEGNLANYDLSGCGCSAGALEACSCSAPMAGLGEDSVYDKLMAGATTLSAAILAGVHGYRRGGALSGALWAAAGYAFPLPTAGVAVYQTASAEQRMQAMQWGRTLPQRLRRGR